MKIEVWKWISTGLVLSGVFLTNLNIYPLNIFSYSAGVASWTIAGISMRDKAVVAKFRLQTPVFAVDYTNLDVTHWWQSTHH